MKSISFFKNHPNLLIAIIALAVLLRVAVAVYMGSQVVDMPGIFDQISYDRLAQQVAAGRGFAFDADWWPATRAGQPTAHWSYLMTVYLAGVYKVFGHQPLVARLIQAVLSGLLMPWLVYGLGARLGDRTTGLLAAGISAVYIYFFYYAGALMTETFFILAVLASLNLALDMAEKPTWKLGLALGASIGAAVLLRQLYLLFVPFLLAWLVWAGKNFNFSEGKIFNFSEKLKIFLPVVLVPLAMILPWTLRNYLAFDQFVLLNNNAGYAFYWANHPIHGTNFISILPAGYPSYKELIPPELLALDEAAMDRALMKLGIGFVLQDPGRYILLSLSRIEDYFLFWPKASSGMVSNLSRVGSFGVFLPFMLGGLALSFFPARLAAVVGENARRRSQYALLYLFMLVYTGIHLASWSYVRYRLPVDAVLVVFAAIGVQGLVQVWHRRRSTARRAAVESV